MKKLLILLFSLLISFNSYGGWFGLTSIEDTTCTDFQEEAKGAKLKNQFGGEFKVLKVSNSREISRTKDKLVCIGDLKLDNGVSNSKLRMELTNEDGELWYQYKQEINSTYDNQTESSKKTVEDIISTSVNLQDTISCQEITDKDKRLSCYDSLSDGLNSSNVKIIPSITKLHKEKRLRIGGPQNPFYGCIYEVGYNTEDPFTNKSTIRYVSVGDPYGGTHLVVEDFEGFFKGDQKGPKVGDCFAFVTQCSMRGGYGVYSNTCGPAKIFKGEYLVDEEVVKTSLKDKLTVDEYCEREVEYGSKIVELNGIVKEATGRESNNWFFIELFADCEYGGISSYYDSDLWKNSDSIKTKLLAIKIGDPIKLRGHFGGNGFQIIEILDSVPREVLSTSITDNPKALDVPNDSNIKRSYTTVVTDLLTVEISHKGGTIINAYLNDYPNELNSEEKFQLLNNTPGSIFHVQSGLIPADQMPTHQSEFTSERQEYFLQGDMGLNVPLIWIGDNGVQVTKNYHFKPNSYIIYIEYMISNNSNKDQILSTYSQFVFELSDALNSGVIFTDKGSADKIPFDEFDTTPKTTSIGGFSAIIYKDFIAAWVPIQNQKITYSTKKLKSRNQYLLTTVNPPQKVLAGTSIHIPKNDLFIGPKELFKETYK